MMNKAYTKLMLQQDMSKDADAAFYKKLENRPSKKRMLSWKAAIAAVCVLLFIPVGVLAAETIFGVTKVTVCERPTYVDNKPGTGLDIVYENLEDYPIEDFSDHLQGLKQYEEVQHESWSAAEEYLGIDLIDNIHFTANDTYCRPAFVDKAHLSTSVHPEKHAQTLKRFGKNAQSTCWVYNDQLFASSVAAEFERDHTVFSVQAVVSVDLPAEIKEDVYNNYHGYSITYGNRNKEKVDINTEQYVSPSGIPMLIVTVTSKGNLENSDTSNDLAYLEDCVVFFSVNNVTYRVHAFGSYSRQEEQILPALLEFLDGFVIE